MAVEYPQNETPSFLMNPLQATIQFLGHYGWGALFVVVSLTILWANLHPKWKEWRERRRNQEAEAELLKRPEKIVAREEAVLAARIKMQEKYDILAAQHVEKMKEKEEMRRLEKIKELDKLEKSGGIHSKYHCQEEQSPTASFGSRQDKSSGRLQGDYNPLMGHGGGSSFRPARRGTSGGGG